MNFDELNTAEKREPVTLFDHIRDQMQPDAPETWVHQAYAGEVINRLQTYKSLHFMVRFWFGQTSGLRAVAEENPEILLDIINHFQVELERLTEIPPTGNRMAEAHSASTSEKDTKCSTSTN